MTVEPTTWRQLLAEKASARIERLHAELDEGFRLAVELGDARNERSQS